jgi:hypothetical protein
VDPAHHRAGRRRGDGPPAGRPCGADGRTSKPSLTASTRWLPDGSGIVIASGLGGGLDLWKVPAEGGAPSRLSVGMGSVGHLAYTMFTPSPDGKYVAYISQKSGAYEVWLGQTNGEPDRQLSRLGSAIESLACVVAGWQVGLLPLASFGVDQLLGGAGGGRSSAATGAAGGGPGGGRVVAGR